MLHWLFAPHFQDLEFSSVWAHISVPCKRWQRSFGFTLTTEPLLFNRPHCFGHHRPSFLQQSSLPTYIEFNNQESSLPVKELGTTERLHFRFSLSCIGEGNGNSLQCSCLENPRDGGAWWAAVYGVAQSQTRLKWLSSSSIERENYKETDCVSS